MITFSSCDKDEDSEPSQQALLTDGEWQGTAVYYNGNNETRFFRDTIEFDVSEIRLRFDDNGEYRQTYGRTVLGTWEFEGNEQEIVILDSGEAYEDRVFINELSSSRLHLDVSWFGPPVELRFTKRR
ncbi:lipocalin-like domain-containing protein [Pontibacter rugosus]